MSFAQFPQKHFSYEHLALLAAWGPESFGKFILLIQSLEQARTWAECNYSPISVAEVKNDTEYAARMFDCQIKGMVACGWGETASSALYYDLRDYQRLQQALLKCYPEANNISEKEAALSVFENCRAR
jgi:hypothetical protein